MGPGRLQLGLSAAVLVLSWIGPALAAGCRLKVVEVRRDGCYLAKPRACPLAIGDKLRARRDRGRQLEVLAASGRFIRARSLGGAPPAAGAIFLPLSPPNPAAPPAKAKGAYKAGPGARSETMAAPFWRAAVAARVPRAAGGRTGRAGGGEDFGYRGSLGVGVQATIDRSDRDRGFLRTFVDSDLGLRWDGPVSLGYAHRLTWQRRLNYGPTSQPWERDYPEWAVREIRFDFSAFGDRLGLSLGRMAPRGVGGARAVDGAIVRGTPIDGLVFGAYGGLLPDPTSLEFISSGLGYGGFVRGQWARSGVRVHGSLLVGGTTFEGQRDELAADALLGFRLSRWLRLTALSRLNFVGATNPLDRPAVDLTRLFVTAGSQPVTWFDLGLRYSFYRWVPTRRSLAEWGEALATGGRPLNALGASAGFSPLAGLHLILEGDLDLQPAGETAAPGIWGGLLARFRLPGTAHRIGLGYRLHDTDALLAHHAEASLLLSILSGLEIELAYRFGHSEQTGPGIAVREHDLNLLVDWLVGWGLHAWIDASWTTGDDVQAVLIFSRIGWRFR